MLIPQTEVIVSKDGVELARKVVVPGEYVIGRGEDVDFQMDTPLASRHHARLTVNYDEWFVEDLASANGTFINDRRLPSQEQTKVFPTQTLRVGDATVTLRRLRDSDAPEASLAPGAATLHTVLPAEIRQERRYAIGQVVAQGGMGAILAAQDQTIRRGVAMKVMLQSGGSEDVLRFIEEAQITGQLEHPNIVPVYELGVDEQDQPFYTMKFVRGISLRKIIELIASGAEATVRKYPLAALLTIFQKVCDGIAFAHAKGVIHRDLKPENIMLGEYGEALVMDWGLAKVLGAKERAATVHSARQENPANATLTGSIMGTPQYMAPEQAAGLIEQLDARTDIYALGAILYQILTLHPPVSGETAEMIVERVRDGKIDFGSLVHASKLPHLPDGRVPDSLAAVVRKAMALDPAVRYASVKELQADIAAFQTGFATKAEKAGAWKQFTLFIRRNKAASIGVAAVLLIGSTFGTKAVIEGRRAQLALAELRATAPTFAAQAGALIEAQKFDEALEKIGFAIKLDPANADYHLFRANTLQAMARLPEAAESYRRVLALRGDDAAARANLDLSEKLLAENGGNAELTAPLKTKLLDAILAQKRQADAVPLSRELKRDTDTAETTIKTRLKAVMAQPGWDAKKLTRLTDGTFKLDLSGLKVPDLTILRGLPISNLITNGLTGVDLTPLRDLPLRTLALRLIKGGNLEGLRGLKLEHLDLTGSDFSDLSPLAGMPLESLTLNDVKKVTDLAPLRGTPLKSLDAAAAGFRDLLALADSPLERLSIEGTWVRSLDGLQKLPLRHINLTDSKVEDLAPLRGMPVKELILTGCVRLHDLSPLAEVPALELLIVPTHISDIAFLKNLPNLKRLSNQPFVTFAWNASRVPLAADFWKKNGGRLARQVPMEKQLEKFRQRLIAEGNDPENVPRFAFDADGSLAVILDKVKCTDISELRGVAVTTFVCNRHLLDLAPLAGAPLTTLNIPQTKVTDLSPIRDARLVVLRLFGTQVRDLSPIRKMPLETILLEGSSVPDVSLLAEIPTLRAITLPSSATGIEKLRSLPKLTHISHRSTNSTGLIPEQTAAEFWKEFDAKKGAAPK